MNKSAKLLASELRRTLTLISFFVLFVSATVVAQTSGMASTGDPNAPDIQSAGIVQHLNAPIPLDAKFVDEQGRSVVLGDYFHQGRPVILNLVYYNCKMLCGQVLDGVAKAASQLEFTPGKQYEIVTVSIDPRETPQLAAQKKAEYLRNAGKPLAGAGWHFLTGQKPDIDRLARAIGWHYIYDPKMDQFLHAAGIVLATPDGKVSQYYYGLDYPARDLRLGIVQASSNHVGNVVDAIELYCCRYDPVIGRYTTTAATMLRDDASHWRRAHNPVGRRAHSRAPKERCAAYSALPLERGASQICELPADVGHRRTQREMWATSRILTFKVGARLEPSSPQKDD